MNAINDYTVYTTRMEKSMYDKLFFIDKIFDEEIDTFVDFGCADGKLIKYVSMFMPQWKYFGYDIDTTMLEEARRDISFADFYNNWEELIAKIDPSKVILNLSSVIHEVYSYCSYSEVEDFWNKILNSGFKYITIRDMVKTDLDKTTPFLLLLNLSSMLDKTIYANEWKEFKEIWGDEPEQLIHFFMKYRYKENWKRELHENYIPFTSKEFEKEFHAHRNIADIKRNDGYTYRKIYKNEYFLPYIANCIKKDFSEIKGQIDLEMALKAICTTHMTYIFERKKEEDE